MLNLKLNLKYTGIDQKAVMKYKEKIEEIHNDLHKRANSEKDFVGLHISFGKETPRDHERESLPPASLWRSAKST